MGKDIAKIVGGFGIIGAGTVALYYMTVASMGLILDGIGNIIQKN